MNLLQFKKDLIYILLFSLIFIISLFIAYCCAYPDCDSIWIYGFTHNISKGLIPYLDFNCCTTPLYYFIGSLFLKVFGNYMISLDIFNAIIITFIFLLLFRMIKFKAFIVFFFVLIFIPNGYNILSLFFLFLILFLIDSKKDNDIIVAFLLGLLFITKQNIGILLFIPYLYYSKKKLMGIFIFGLPLLAFSLYFYINNALFEFIDYCFLGMFDFASGNLYLSFWIYVEFFILIWLFYLLIRSKFKDKELFYIIMFQGMMYPFANHAHFFCAFLPVFYYFLKKTKNHYALLFTLLVGLFCNIQTIFSNYDQIHLENDILYLKNSSKYLEIFQSFNKYIDGTENYFFSGAKGYLYKLYFDISIDKFDLWNEGNMGYKGIEERILELDNICKNENCLFFVEYYDDPNLNNQSQVDKFYSYVVNNYEKISDETYFSVYSN